VLEAKFRDATGMDNVHSLLDDTVANLQASTHSNTSKLTFSTTFNSFVEFHFVTLADVISSICHLLDKTYAINPVHLVLLVLSCLDYGNAKLEKLPASQIPQLQFAMKAGAQLTINTKQFHQFSSLLQELPWLGASKPNYFR
jgi:hypothetical protein